MILCCLLCKLELDITKWSDIVNIKYFVSCARELATPRLRRHVELPNLRSKETPLNHLCYTISTIFIEGYSIRIKIKITFFVGLNRFSSDRGRYILYSHVILKWRIFAVMLAPTKNILEILKISLFFFQNHI